MSFIRRALDRLRGVKHIGWVLLAASLAALVLAGGGETGLNTGATGLERRMESVLSCVEGAGRVRVLVNGGGQEETPRSGQGGVVVVAEGAGELRVRMELERAVTALLGVESSQIEILGMKGEDAR